MNGSTAELSGQFVQSRSSTGEHVLKLLDVTIPQPKVSTAYGIALAALALTLLIIATAFAGIVAFMAWLVVWHIMGALISLPQGPYFIFHLPMAILGLFLFIFLVKPVFFRPKEKKTHILTLSPSDEPLLFEYVRKLCGVVGAKPPAVIEVDCDANASASFRRGLGGIAGRQLVLRIGLPLVAALPLRQFTGVLAHELGHFNQHQGMLWSYLIRRLNYFFVRIVFQRDRMDMRLQRLRANKNSIGFLFYLAAAALLEPARGVLWLMLLIGELLSCHVMRRMEYDADSMETHIAGADNFVSTNTRLAVLQLADAQTREDLAAAFSTKRLPEDLPRLIASRADDLAKYSDEIIESMDSKTRWLDTHPSHADRNRSARQLGQAGAVYSDEPAAVLFADFADVCRRASESYYRSVVGDEVKQVKLVSVTEMAGQQAGDRDAIKQVRRYYQDQVTLSRPNFPDADSARPPADPNAAARELADCRDRVVAYGAQMGSALEQYDQARIETVIAAAHNSLAGIVPNPQTRSQVLRRAQAKSSAATAAIAAACAKIDPFEAAARRRLKLGLQLLHDEALAQRLENATAAQADVRIWLALGHQLHGCCERLRKACDLGLKARFLYAAYTANPPFMPLETRIIDTLADAVQEMQYVRGQLGQTPYPFEHGVAGAACAEYLLPEMPDRRDVDNVAETAIAAMDRFGSLWLRIHARLIGHAEAVEASLDLAPLADPDDKAKREQARQQATRNNRRDAIRYWLGFGARATAGVTMLAFLVGYSINPPNLPNMPWDDGRPGGLAYRPAAFSWNSSARVVATDYRPSPPPGQPHWYTPGNPGYYQPGQPGHQAGMPTYWQPGFGQYYSPNVNPTVPGQPGQPGVAGYNGMPGQPGAMPGTPGYQPYRPGQYQPPVTFRPPVYQPPSHQNPSRPGQPGYDPTQPGAYQPGRPGYTPPGSYQPPSSPGHPGSPSPSPGGPSPGGGGGGGGGGRR